MVGKCSVRLITIEGDRYHLGRARVEVLLFAENPLFFFGKEPRARAGWTRIIPWAGSRRRRLRWNYSRLPLNAPRGEPSVLRGDFMPPLIIETPQSLKDFVGREIAVTEWFTVTQERIRQFGEVTDDRQWIHVDQDRAQRESPYGTTIAHGFLTLSLLSRFLREAIQIRGGVRMRVNYGLNRARFPAPVRAESQIRARVSVQSTKELPGATEAAYSLVLECRGEAKPCCVAECIVRYYHG